MQRQLHILPSKSTVYRNRVVEAGGNIYAANENDK